MLVEGELDDTGVVYIECPNKHRTAVVFDARRYEVLLRSGAKALLAGFASESIASLASALERAHDFYIRVVCRHHGIAPEQFEAAGEAVKSQSERQLGAFMFLYLREMGEHLPLNKKIPEIRNRIVHQGRIAKEAAAREFGELVFGRICQIERALERFPAASAAEAAHDLEVQRQSIPPDIEQATFQVRSVLVQDGKVTGPASTFEQYIAALRQGVEKGLA